MSIWESLAGWASSAKILQTVRQDERGIRLKFGVVGRVLGAGVWWTCPVIHKIVRLTVTPQVVNLPNQSVMTKDGKVVAVSGAVEYDIVDVVKAYLGVQDFDMSIQNTAMGYIASQVSGRTMARCRDLEQLGDDVMSEMDEKAMSWGIRLRNVRITDLVPHRVIRLMQADQPIPAEEE